MRDWKQNQLPHLYSLKGIFYDYGYRLFSKVLEFSVEHPEDMVAEKFGISIEDFVYRIIRLRVLDNHPIIMEYTYMPI